MKLQLPLRWIETLVVAIARALRDFNRRGTGTRSLPFKRIIFSILVLHAVRSTAILGLVLVRTCESFQSARITREQSVQPRRSNSALKLPANFSLPAERERLENRGAKSVTKRRDTKLLLLFHATYNAPSFADGHPPLRDGLLSAQPIIAHAVFVRSVNATIANRCVFDARGEFFPRSKTWPARVNGRKEVESVLYSSRFYANFTRIVSLPTIIPRKKKRV